MKEYYLKCLGSSGNWAQYQLFYAGDSHQYECDFIRGENVSVCFVNYFNRESQKTTYLHQSLDSFFVENKQLEDFVEEFETLLDVYVEI